VPLIKRQSDWQIGGNAAAYGNVGSVAFLTVTAFYLRGCGNRIFPDGGLSP